MEKIIIYCQSLAPAAGIERVVSNLANNLCEYYTIEVLTKDDKTSYFALDERVIQRSINTPLSLDMNNRLSRIYSLFFNTLRSVFRLKSFLKKSNFDYIYVTTPLSAYEVKTAMGNKEFQKKAIISEHASKEAPNGVYQLLKKITYGKCKKLVVPTTRDTKLYKKEGFPAVYIPHHSSYNSQKKHSMNKKVLNVGRFTNDKQQIILLQIWKMIIQEIENFDWTLAIVGTGELREELASYIERNNMSTYVSLLPPTKNINQYYSESSIFAFTSKLEGFGMVLLEAMSFGNACISFDCPSGPRDIIKDSVNGYLIPCNDIRMYKEKLCKMILDENERISMQKKALETIENWDNDQITKSWCQVFKKGEND